MRLISDDIDFTQYMTEQEDHKIRRASHWRDDTIAAFHSPEEGGVLPGMLWEKAKDKIRFRPGEVSLWAGINGHGKSMYLSQVTLDLIYQAERVLVLSFEMQPMRQMHRMCRQASGSRIPDKAWIEEFAQWTDGRLWIYDHVGAVDWKKLMAVLRYAVATFGIQHFVIDSLMKCVKGDDDYNAQKDFVNELCSFVQAHGVHVHLVHHVRKGESEHKTPGKFDVKGAGAITDQVDNVFIVWRNKKAEEAQDDPNPTCLLCCEKQRNGEYEGKLGFWFDHESQQYMESMNEQPAGYNINNKMRGSAKGYPQDVRFFVPTLGK